MIKKLKNTGLEFILLLAILLNSSGYLIIYQQLKYSFRREALKKIQEFIPENKLERISISIDDIAKGKISFVYVEEFEVKYKGSMFDVYNKQILGDSLVIYALRDENENLLDQALIKYISEVSSKSNSTNPVIKLLRLLITDAIPNTQGITAEIYYYMNEYPVLKQCLLSFISEIKTPPPNIRKQNILALLKFNRCF